VARLLAIVCFHFFFSSLHMMT